MSTQRVILQCIIPYTMLPFLCMIPGFLLVAFVMINVTIVENTTVWQGTCSFKEWNQRGDLGMILDCGEGGEPTLTNDSVIRSHLHDPRPRTCKLASTRVIDCEESATKAE